MPRKPGTIICDAERMPALRTADGHEISGHHRSYGSTAFNGGERIVETRRGWLPRWLRFFFRAGR
jgi:hypothetical protein